MGFERAVEQTDSHIANLERIVQAVRLMICNWDCVQNVDELRTNILSF